MTLKEWVLFNLQVGGLSFGSASRLFLYEEEVVGRKSLLTPEKFSEIFTLSQILPGPNLVNLCFLLGKFLGGKTFAYAGLFSLVLPGALFISFLGFLINLESSLARAAFKGFAVASVGVFLIYVIRLCRESVFEKIETRGWVIRNFKNPIILIFVFISSLVGVPVLYNLGCALSISWILEIFLERRSRVRG